MRTSVIALLALPALAWTIDPAALHATAVASPSSQEPSPTPVPKTEPLPEIPKLIEELGSPDDAARSRAREALAKHGAAARAALEQAAKDSVDPEVRWNARKLLRRIEEQEATPPPSQRLERHRADPGPGVEELDPQAPQTERAPAVGRSVSKSIQVGPDGGVKVTVVEEVDGKRETRTYEAESMEALKKQHPDLLGGAQVGPLQGIPWLPELRLEIDRLREGLGDRRMFEGLEELRRELERDLAEKQGPLQERLRPLREGLRPLDQHWRQLEQEMRPLRERLRELGGGEQLPPIDELSPARELAPHERLGVKVEPLHPEVARFLELEEGTGLRVVEVVDGSLAESLGLREKDVLVSIQGEAVRTPESIRAALARTPLEAKVRVEVLRFSSGRVSVEALRPPSQRELPPGAEPKKLEGPGKSGDSRGGK